MRFVVILIRFDDVPESSWVSYQLPTSRQDPLTLAQRAFELMERRLENPGLPPGCERVIPQLVIRQSFRPDPPTAFRRRHPVARRVDA
ncbi:DNA-binding LacI/PurR family transcriptional regulator [Rhizobium brockwellii]